MNEQCQRRAKRGASGRVLVAAIALSGIALLIWGKLRMVTGIPRTAYAAPREKAADGRASADAEDAVPPPADDGRADR